MSLVAFPGDAFEIDGRALPGANASTFELLELLDGDLSNDSFECSADARRANYRNSVVTEASTAFAE